MRALTQKVNNIIRRDRCKTVSSIYSLTKYRKANFMKTSASQRDAFIESRKSFIKPIFNKMIHDIEAVEGSFVYSIGRSRDLQCFGGHRAVHLEPQAGEAL